MYVRENPKGLLYFLVVVMAVVIYFIVSLPDAAVERQAFVVKSELMLTFGLLMFTIIEGYSTYFQAVTYRKSLQFTDLKNEIENCYGPIYHTLLNIHFLDAIEHSEDGNPSGDVHYEAGERQNLDKIFENYSYLLNMDVYHDWKQYSGTRGADDGGIDLPFSYVERLMIEHETRVTNYRKLVGK